MNITHTLWRWEEKSSRWVQIGAYDHVWFARLAFLACDRRDSVQLRRKGGGVLAWQGPLADPDVDPEVPDRLPEDFA